jgi:hypothetical protein
VIDFADLHAGGIIGVPDSDVLHKAAAGCARLI